MKKRLLLSLCILLLLAGGVVAQCSLCTRTAQQLGEKPASTLNSGILYLALTPLIILGVIGYTWLKKHR